MRKSLIFLVILMLEMGLLQAAVFEKEAKSGTTKVHMSSDRPLTVGSNALTMGISQAGTPVKAVSVSVRAFMPAMPGMPAMESKVDAKDLGNGNYEATVNLSMGGTWQLHIFITPAEGKRSRVKTSLIF